ncbi:AraJ, Arabinose efflux permease [Pyrenophora tritici-repentis]|uniref:ProP, Permease major facilitator superfamily n=1 Tax=Pyrenophora tritici-repentis TaxID=45151 RepID=A0A2W1GRP1_9PLEO|nr:ProP, Permease major facilitator superfamily [Pyrenophora tritici-repentis]PZC92167.1 AraJ, Arabinose efflux permease [Pyrenophora tritici-repentis]PZD26000.1 AraJ, Arabinose efflux permease [Pyrenophora tritici-repentis]PZD37042.1 AraJ, Arabinose efflux permease [Pyrenophora tritici-repentis]
MATSTPSGHPRPSSEHTLDADTAISVLQAINMVETKESAGPLKPTPGTSLASEALSKHRIRIPFQTLAAFTALSLSIFLVALDTVLIPTALLTISQTFHIPDSLYAWTGSAYLLANAASVPFWGKLSDVFGRKPVIQAANITFLLGSIISAVSVNAAMLVTGRAVQGLGGGGIVVLVNVCVSDMFRVRDRSFYMGTIGAVWAVASALGPVLGGVFAQQLDWRWMFYINIPIVSASIAVLHFTLRLHNPRTPVVKGLASIDWLGTATIVIATILLLVGLQSGGASSFANPSVIMCLVFGSVAYLAFPFSQWWEDKRGGTPIMPLRLFKDVSNLSALGVCACDALVFNSVAYFLPLYFQIVLQRSPTIAGVYMLAIAIPLALVSFASGHVIEKTGRFLEIIQAGLLLTTLGVGLLISLDMSLHIGKIVGVLLVIGLGFGPNFGAPLIALQTRLQETDIATGTAAFGFVRMISGAIGLVAGQVVFQLLMASHFQSFVDSGIASDYAHALAGGQAISQGVDVSALTEGQRFAVRYAFMAALKGTWILYTVIGALGLLVSFGITRTKLQRESTCCTELDDIRASV